MISRDAAQVLYLKWLKVHHPDVWQGAVNANPGTREGLGWVVALVNAVVAAGSLVMAKKQAAKQLSLQKKAMAADAAAQEAARQDALKLALLDVNTKRAQAGLPPVDENNRVLTDTRAIANAGAKVANYLPYVLIGGAALIAIVFIRRR